MTIDVGRLDMERHMYNMELTTRRKQWKDWWIL